MTAYFDTVTSRLRELQERLDHPLLDEELDTLEEALVRDVTLCAAWPGCPDDIAAAIHLMVLKWSVSAQPLDAVWQCPDYEDTAARLAGLYQMTSSLHLLFHELGSRRLDAFSDDPTCPVRTQLAIGQDRQAMLTRPNARLWRTQLVDYDPVEREQTIARLKQRERAFVLRSTGCEAEAATAEADLVAALQG